MSDASEKGSLTITEKKNSNNQKQGGCVGIFFQLFDWNRRVTKKRFFSNKLLPPACAKQDSLKKFKGDEKMPNSKFHLIANRNNGGFTNAKKVEQKHEMRVPSLVARLMGLESIPSSKRDNKSKKSSSFSDSDSDESLDEKQDVDFEIKVANARHDSRPQKHRKTEANERRSVTRFGAEALQIKSVLSQVRRYNHHHHHHHHSKLVSPLKSPRVSSGKSASRSSRLIEAATKILEPGLQAKCRSKYSLTSSISKYPLNNGIMTEMAGHTCKNCGNSVDSVGCKQEIEISTPIVSDVFTKFSSISAQKGMPFVSSHENDVVFLRSQEKIITLVDENVKKNAYSCNKSTSRRMHVHAKCDDDNSSFAFKSKTRTQERVLSSERMSHECRTSNIQEKRVSSVGTASPASGNKEFVASNRSLTGRTRIRSPTKENSCKIDLERKSSNRQGNLMAHLSAIERKRRIPNVSQVGDTDNVNFVTLKHRNVSSNAQRGKRRNFDALSPSNCNVKCKRGGYIKTDKISDNNRINNAIEKEETRSDNEIKTCYQRHSPLRGDAIGAFLEQKLKELITRENEELATSDQPKRSSALILHELIAVLSAKHLICSDDHMLDDKDHKHETNHVRLLRTSCNGNHLSPGSVLEASFSSSSLDESSGHGFHLDSINRLYDQPQRLERDTKLFDSSISFNIGKIGCKILAELVNQIHKILQSLDSFWTRLTVSKLNHMKEVIFNTELVLGNVERHNEGGVLPQLLVYRILDELDNMVNDATQRNFNFNGFMSYEESENRSQLRGFMFDCVIEFLESNCCQHYYNVFKLWSAWTKVPLCMKADILIHEVKSEIKKLECNVGMVPDQIIEWEINHSVGKWSDFNVEAFEVGVDIDGDVIQILVDEIVEDLVDFRHVII